MTGTLFRGDPEGHFADDEEFWQRVEAELAEGGASEKQIEEARRGRTFRAHLHPRDRLGRFREVPDYIRGIVPNAHVVGGAVRDKLLGKEPKDYDFLAPGMDHADLRAALEPHGRVDDLIVDGRQVGVRFHPNDKSIPAPPEGIEIAPPRTEISTGPGRHEFEIVADATVPPEKDMERRDFTVNAIAEAPPVDTTNREAFLAYMDSFPDGTRFTVEGGAQSRTRAIAGTWERRTVADMPMWYAVEGRQAAKQEGREGAHHASSYFFPTYAEPVAEALGPRMIDPLGGVKDAEAKVLRVIGETAFRDDGLRIIRGLRFISQHDLTPDDETLAQMRDWARRIDTVSGERIRDEFHKLLMGKHPAKALRVARDTGVLRHMFPEWEPTIGFEQQSRYHGLTADEHIFGVVQASADAGDPLAVRIAAFWHDSGKPESAWLGEDGKLHYYENPALGKDAHEDVSARLFRKAAAQERLAYPVALREQVAAVISNHMFQDHANPSPVRARKFLAKHGYERALMLLAHKRADIRGKQEDSDEKIASEIERLDKFAAQVERQKDSAYHVRHLAINGDDLIRLGYTPGPDVGGALDAMLAQVIGQPKNNEREWLEREALRLLRTGVPIRKRERDAGGGTAGNRAMYEEMFPQQQDVDDARRSIVEYLRMVAAMRRRALPEGAVYAGGEDVVLNHGRFFRKKAEVPPRDFPPEVCIPRQCFSNALTSVMAGEHGNEWAKGLVYVEGWAQPEGLFPVHHAWLVDREGNVYDPTWDFHREVVYLGVPFKYDFVAEEAVKRGTDTIFDFEFPYEQRVTDEITEEIPGYLAVDWVARHAGTLTDFDAQAEGIA